jgi:hypothetical protein
VLVDSVEFEFLLLDSQMVVHQFGTSQQAGLHLDKTLNGQSFDEQAAEQSALQNLPAKLVSVLSLGNCKSARVQ